MEKEMKHQTKQGLVIQKTHTITDLSTWFKYAEPEGGEKQWVVGRSAMEFARYMTNSKNGLPKEIADYLIEIGINSLSAICIPEHVTDFPSEFGTGSGRHHDGLLILEECVVGIEAKVSESFDVTIAKWLRKGENNKDRGKNRLERISESIKLISTKPFEEAKGLYYQLVSATIGTILEAVRNKKNKACLLVIEFGGDIDEGGTHKNYIKSIQNNAKAFKDYLEFLGIDNRSDKESKITVNYNDYSVDLWIKKLHIDISLPKETVKYN